MCVANTTSILQTIVETAIMKMRKQQQTNEHTHKSPVIQRFILLKNADDSRSWKNILSYRGVEFFFVTIFPVLIWKPINFSVLHRTFCFPPINGINIQKCRPFSRSSLILLLSAPNQLQLNEWIQTGKLATNVK